MNLILQRIGNYADGILGHLTDENGLGYGCTMEHAYQAVDGLDYLPKVAAGVYKCVRHAPNRLPYETFELQNVPDFQGKPVTGILIHIGNYNTDSDGCILVGSGLVVESSGVHMLLHSKNTFELIMDTQKGLNEFTLTIKDIE